ncbi:MAG: di/tricarboxylate transporter [Planctomycetota bacterium]|jgi:di/tricarboxylate transporter
MFEIEPITIVLATLLGSLVLFVTEALRFELVAILVVVVLAGTGCLTQEEAFSGFSSPAVVLIAAMYIFGHSFTRWGVAEALSNKFLRVDKGGEGWLVLRLVMMSGILSAFLSNTGVVATLIPVCSSLSRTSSIPISRLLMPMAFGTSVGGLVTVIATSKNLAVNQVIEAAGVEPFSLFEFSHFGVLMLSVASLYFWGFGRRLLPRSRVDQSLTERYQLPKFVTEVLVEPNSTLINRSVEDADHFSKYNISIIGIVRSSGEATLLAPGRYSRIRAEDTLILQGQPNDILRMRKDMKLLEKKWVDTKETRLYSDDVSLVEALIPAGSPIVGESLVSCEFQTRTGLNVLALSKHGEIQIDRVQSTTLNVGDVLLVQGHRKDIANVASDRRLVILDDLPPPTGNGAIVTILMLAAVLILAVLTDLPLSVLAMAGAAGLVLLGAVHAEEVPKIINWSVIFLIGGMLALGRAFTTYGLDATVATWLTGLSSSGVSQHGLILVLLVTTVILTQVLNHVSTAVIMAPIAIQVGKQWGLDPRPFLMAVIAGSAFAFLSPVAHQSNAMVLGPGGYQYKDFLKAGSVLTIVMIATSYFLIPLFWPFTPA